MKNKILFIERESDLSDVLRIYLENHYYIAFSSSNIDSLHRLEKEENIKLIIYNNEPPLADGLEFLKIIRKNHYSTPFIMLSDETDIKEEVEIIKNTLFLSRQSDIESILQIIETIVPGRSPKEKRQYPRLKINQNVDLYCTVNQKKLKSFIENISLGGMRLRMDGEKENFDDTSLEFLIDNFKIILTKVKTVYFEKNLKDENVYGIKFIEVSDESSSNIHNLVTNLIKKAIITSSINI
jgi:DNA-binding response OmpR family regulator